MKFFILLPALAAVALTTGCTTLHDHETDKNSSNPSPNSVVVNFKQNEVSTGDRVKVYEVRCKTRVRRGDEIPVCKTVDTAQGLVTALLTDEKAIVTFEQKVSLNSQSRFERISDL